MFRVRHQYPVPLDVRGHMLGQPGQGEAVRVEVINDAGDKSDVLGRPGNDERRMDVDPNMLLPAGPSGTEKDKKDKKEEERKRREDDRKKREDDKKRRDEEKRVRREQKEERRRRKAEKEAMEHGADPKKSKNA
jgi:hypothetical protein